MKTNNKVVEQHLLSTRKIWPIIRNSLETVRDRSHIRALPLVPNSVIFNDLEWRDGRYFALFYRIR